jgi:predicted nucleic-acid-binding protein
MENLIDITPLDTNAVIRIFERDIPEQTSAVLAYIASHKCIVYLEVAEEVIHALECKWYNYTREQSVVTLKNLMQLHAELFDKPDVLSFALDLYSERHGLDFVDCLLAGYNHVYGCPIFTFDRRLANQIKRQNKEREEGV